MNNDGKVPWLKVHDYLIRVGSCRTSPDFTHIACEELRTLIPYDTAAAIHSTFDTRCLDHVGLSDAVKASYNDYYRTRQPFFMSGDGKHQDFTFLASTPVVDWHRYRKLEYATDFMLPNGMYKTLAHVFPSHKITLSVQRSRMSPEFSETEVSILDILNKDLNALYTCLDHTGDPADALTPQKIADRFHSLSKREAELCSLLARRLSNVEISECLSISRRTVEKHVESIFEKLEVRSREQLRIKLGVAAPSP